jgi:hypothetical protein
MLEERVNAKSKVQVVRPTYIGPMNFDPHRDREI